MKAGATGRRRDATKLLQTQRRDSQRRMEDFVYGEAFPEFPPFSEEPMHTKSLRGRRKAAAPPTSEKNATRRRVSPIILASVVK